MPLAQTPHYELLSPRLRGAPDSIQPASAETGSRGLGRRSGRLLLPEFMRGLAEGATDRLGEGRAGPVADARGDLADR